MIQSALYNIDKTDFTYFNSDTDYCQYTGIKYKEFVLFKQTICSSFP